MATCIVKRKTPPPAPPLEIESVTVTMTKHQADKLVALLGGTCGGSFASETSLANVYEELDKALVGDRVGYFEDYFEIRGQQLHEVR